jgi:hypothetical protein
VAFCALRVYVLCLSVFLPTLRSTFEGSCLALRKILILGFENYLVVPAKVHLTLWATYESSSVDEKYRTQTCQSGFGGTIYVTVVVEVRRFVVTAGSKIPADTSAGVVDPTAIFLNATDLYHAAGTLFLSGPHF